MRLLLTVWLGKENSYFAQSEKNKTFMGPKMQKYVQDASLNIFNRFC